MKLRPALVLLFALSAGCVYAQSAADLGAGPKPRKAATWPLEPTAEQAQAAQLSARFLTRFHYDAQPLDDAMSARIYKAYLKMLDGDKVFFTQADMDKFAPLKTKFDDAIWNSDLSAPFAIFNLYVQRAVQRMTYARSLLKDGFDLSRDESYDVDRKDAAWPKDKAAADDLWRKRTKNDWLRLKLAGKDDADIRKTLDKRYSGYIDRIRQINSADAFQTFMNAYAESTDPHTDYLGPEAAANFDIAMSLSLQGIGAQLQSRDDYTMIVKLIAGGPAMKSHKLKPGDRIVAVGQGDKGAMVDVVGWRIDDVTALIRGKKGTVVRLEVLPADVGPDGKHELLTLVRDKINLEDAAASKNVIEIKDGGVTRKIGVIDLPSFYSDFGARSAGDKDFRSTTRDVAKLIAQKMGVKAQLVPVASANRIAYLQTHKADLVISTLGKNAEREKVIDFSQPYAPYNNSVFGVESVKVSGPADLAGKTVGVARGTFQDLQLTDTAPKSATIKRYEDNNAMISAYVSGQVQLVGTGDFVAYALAEKAPNNKPVLKYIIQESSCSVGVNKNEAALLAKVNDALTAAKKSGELNAIVQKWLNVPLPAKMAAIHQ